MGPDNIILGDATGVDLPQKPVDDLALHELKKKAKYKKSKEYADLREKAQARIDFYKTFLPDGTPILATTREQRADAWALANIIIAEFEQLFGEHEQAEILLKEEFGE